MINRKIIISIFSIVFLIYSMLGCASTSQNTSQDGFMKSWSNPKFKGGETLSLVAYGYSTITNSDVDKARNNALENAKQNSLAMAMNEILNSEKLSENNIVINNTIYSQTDNYIASYKVIEDELSNKDSRIKIETKVDINSLEKKLIDIGVLTAAPIVVMLVVDEYEKMSEAFNIALEEYMGKSDFQFVDSKTLNKVLSKEKIKISDVYGSKSTSIIQKIAAETGAQIAIIGNAEAYFASYIEATALKSYRSNVAIRAINISDMKTIAQAKNQTTGVSDTYESASALTLQKSAEIISAEISKQITTKWKSIVEQTYDYNLTVIGLEHSSLQAEFEKKLTDWIARIKRVNNRGFANGTARFIIKYAGSASGLTEDIVKNAQDMGFHIEVKAIEDKSITISAMPFVN